MRIFREIDIVESRDYITPGYDFSMKFKTSIPKRAEWKKGAAHLAGDSAQIYTDGSKLKGAVGIGIYRHIQVYEADYCSGFQAEVSATQTMVEIIVAQNVHKRRITILSDSQAAIKALDSSVISYRTVYNCRRCLNEMAGRI